MRPRRQLPLCLVAVVLAAALPARADEPATVRLSWVRAAGAEACPDESALAAAVSEHLGRDPFVERADRSIEAVATRDATEWLARIYVRGPGGALVGAREIRSDDAACSALSAAVALAVALTIDPDALQRAPAATAPPAGSSPPPGALPRPVRPVRPRAPRPEPPRVTATARALGALELLPGPAAGFGVYVDLPVVARFRARAGATVFPEVRTPPPNTGFAVGLSAGVLGGCVEAVGTRVVSLAGCVNVAAGVIHVVVFSLEPTVPGDRPWIATSLAAELDVRLVGPLVAHVGLEAVVPLVRHRFVVVDRPDAVFLEPPIAGILHLGAGVAFP